MTGHTTAEGTSDLEAELEAEGEGFEALEMADFETEDFESETAHSQSSMRVNTQLKKCINSCSLRCPDTDVKYGCNQMFSCAQACKMRELGMDTDRCK